MKAVWGGVLAGAFVAGSAGAADGSLVGQYEGTLTAVDGYAAQVGAPCTVAITSSDKFGASLSFKISDLDPYVIEEKKVAEALKSGPEAKLISRMTDGIEVLVLKRDEGGTMQGVRLIRKRPQIQSEQSISCGELKSAAAH